jgi:hypothetical protein
LIQFGFDLLGPLLTLQEPAARAKSSVHQCCGS